MDFSFEKYLSMINIYKVQFSELIALIFKGMVILWQI